MITFLDKQGSSEKYSESMEEFTEMLRQELENYGFTVSRCTTQPGDTHTSRRESFQVKFFPGKKTGG